MARAVTTTIDPELCTGCGLCVSVCPADTIEMIDGKAKVTGKRSIACGHCAAICPTKAIRVGDIDPESLEFSSFTLDQNWLAPGKFDPAELVRLMASRRSCRNFTDASVSQEILADLVKIGVTAPSGTNSQRWTFTILDERHKVATLGNQIALYFEKLNRLAANPLIRYLTKAMGKPALSSYYRRHYQSVEKSLQRWREEGKDQLFHGATAAILIGSRPGASCPSEDALLASQNILLAAHAMGLGTCLIGFAMEAIARDSKCKKLLQLPNDEPIYAVIALGHPKEPYQRLTGRKKPLVRFPLN
ncbi:MAG: nitroreductase family protein [Desulfobulbaceae bacterium]|nr:nitroreductase family protein [Desulfobulbaceae bacterium]